MKLTPVGWVDGIQDVFSDINSILPKVDYRIWKNINCHLLLHHRQRTFLLHIIHIMNHAAAAVQGIKMALLYCRFHFINIKNGVSVFHEADCKWVIFKLNTSGLPITWLSIRFPRFSNPFPISSARLPAASTAVSRPLGIPETERKIKHMNSLPLSWSFVCCCSLLFGRSR